MKSTLAIVLLCIFYADCGTLAKAVCVGTSVRAFGARGDGQTDDTPAIQSAIDAAAAAGGGSVVGLDFDARVAWPVYDWMGVAKAALESLARYLARDVGSAGVRVNLVAAGPARTLAAKSIPGFERFEEVWSERAPLGWDVTDSKAVAQACVAMLSDWFPMTTGEILHVDGGFHAVGA